MIYTIGEMAKKLGTSASTLRYYDKEGLLPFLEHPKGSIRVFTDKDYEWLHIVECLKKTGMQLKDIRAFIHMAMQGDETINERLQLFIKQREIVQKQIDQLQQTMDVINFKCWYYETAKEAGTTSVLDGMAPEDFPEEYREVRRRIMGQAEK
ncbi:MAG: MerR family transcriptional regulator [Lachnospiraceae bacterium]|nr:MerR family transcriptional regulator [Lachnospiraceae bacterium]